MVEDGRVEFRPENAFIAPLIYLGQQADWDSEMIVDRLCDHPATAVRVSSRLWGNLVGSPPDRETAAELGRWWQDRGLAIMPLVDRILHDPAFADGRLTRPRTGLEWYCGAKAALGFDDEIWYLENLNQMPYLPPSVAGWPDDGRWLNPGSLLARASMVHSIDLGELVVDAADGEGATETDRILRRCSLHEVSAETRAAIDGVGRNEELSPESVTVTRWRLALTSPEFNLS